MAMERHIYRGETLIGRIIHPAESGAPVFGTEVFALSEFGNVDPDADTQFESNDSAEDFLHRLYEAHCTVLGITPEPRPAKPMEVDPESAYHEREAALAAEEYAHHMAQIERERAAGAAVGSASHVAPREALARAILGLTDEQASHAYNALAQWADNTRNGLEETYDDPECEGAKELAQVETVDGLVDAYETALAQLVEASLGRPDAARDA